MAGPNKDTPNPTLSLPPEGLSVAVDTAHHQTAPQAEEVNTH
jgi:hypothetical protein